MLRSKFALRPLSCLQMALSLRYPIESLRETARAFHFMKWELCSEFTRLHTTLVLKASPCFLDVFLTGDCLNLELEESTTLSRHWLEQMRQLHTSTIYVTLRKEYRWQ